jgi:predicted dehydrogenase
MEKGDLMHKIVMLGTGLIGRFYTMAIHGQRSRDRVQVVYSRTAERAQAFAEEFGIPVWTTDLAEAIGHPDTNAVVIGLPNHRHEEAVQLSAVADKAVFCTKPLARTAAEAKRMLDLVEQTGIFHGYLEDLVYTPKAQKALLAVRNGALGKILWTRSRETHPGPHSDWFWDKEQSGGGAIIDLGCHCIAIGRNFIGKQVRPIEVMCWAATQVHPIEAEDSAIGLVRYANGAISQFEVSWTFRGGMDLRDEVSGTEGTLWLNHFLRTGFEMFSANGMSGYVAEKSESERGWLFPVGDELTELGYVPMFSEMFNALDQGTPPTETFYDGYIVNAIMDAAYRSAASKRWEPVEIEDWRGADDTEQNQMQHEYNAQYWLVKEEIMPDGSVKLILKEKASGRIVQRVDHTRLT